MATWEVVAKATDDELKRRRNPILLAACTGARLSVNPFVMLVIEGAKSTKVRH